MFYPRGSPGDSSGRSPGGSPGGSPEMSPEGSLSVPRVTKANSKIVVFQGPNKRNTAI